MKSSFKSHHALHSFKCCLRIIVSNLLPMFYIVNTLDRHKFKILYCLAQLSKGWHWWVRQIIIAPRRLRADSQYWTRLVSHKTFEYKVQNVWIALLMLIMMMIMIITPFPSSAKLSSHSGGSLSDMMLWNGTGYWDLNHSFIQSIFIQITKHIYTAVGCQISFHFEIRWQDSVLSPLNNVLILLHCHKSLAVSDELAHISDHRGRLHQENIFNRSRVNFCVHNLFVILEIKSFGEIRLILTIKALVPFLTLSFPEVLLQSEQSSKLATTVLALN